MVGKKNLWNQRRCPLLHCTTELKTSPTWTMCCSFNDNGMKHTTCWLALHPFLFSLSLWEVKRGICRDSNYLWVSLACLAPSLSVSLSLYLIIQSVSVSEMNEWMLLGGLSPPRTDVAPGCHGTRHSAVTPTNQTDALAPPSSIQCTAGTPVCPLRWRLAGPEQPWQVICVVLLRGFHCWTQQTFCCTRLWPAHIAGLCVTEPRACLQFKPTAPVLKNANVFFP